ncbi:hypothetical protein [Candidatus Cyanaurora vandensis]|uniref:hypothetical protein n=1 Tax=Candidatus Cyanaurora vandensis TaxID=2714958 RepID=UPI00257A893D|nr:hypothetical protein [Candidatus Cyanaurora vandensis]
MMMRVLVVLLILGRLSVRAEEPELVEEVARLEVLDYARSPMDNRVLTLGEYAALQADLQQPNPARPNGKLQGLITLLRLRKLLKTVIPLIP